MEGHPNAPLRHLGDNDSRGVLSLSEDVMAQLQEKHPEPQKTRLGSLLFSPVEDILDYLYQQIDGEMIRDAALPKDQEVPRPLMQWGLKEISAANHSGVFQHQLV